MNFEYQRTQTNEAHPFVKTIADEAISGKLPRNY
jgi:hypothetical protein